MSHEFKRDSKISEPTSIYTDGAEPVKAPVLPRLDKAIGGWIQPRDAPYHELLTEAAAMLRQQAAYNAELEARHEADVAVMSTQAAEIRSDTAWQLQQLVADHAFAMTFQSITQYRTALLKAIATGKEQAKLDAYMTEYRPGEIANND